MGDFWDKALTSKALSMQKIQVKVEHDHIQRITTANPIAAISELIWNAYDADASEVQVELQEGQLTKLGAIRVIDDGAGIPFDEVKDTLSHLVGHGKNKQ